MEITEGYYDCVPYSSVDSKHGACTVYPVYWHGQTMFTVRLYDKSQFMISIHEEEKSDE